METHIYGVEKDYRLARVSKISMFMNGAGGSNIVFGDGLENYPEKGITPASFDILVANPPYAVKGFKKHLKLKNNTFSIIDKVSTDGKEIEVLFVERIAQLLKPKGIAAVVLPSSILNDTSSSGIAARETLLQNFFIHAIVAFGSQTFGATGTNTVTLFLERFNEPPRLAELAKDTVEGIMSHGGDADWEDKQVLNAYISHQRTDKETYLAFLQQALTKEQILADSYLKSYIEAFKPDGIKYPQKCTEEEKALIRKKKYYGWALEIEREKLYYFTLVYQQQTLIITAPTDNKEQKDFLGYEWSNRKGQEGIKIKQPGGKLYNAEDRFAKGTLASAVRNSFGNAITTSNNDNIVSFAKTYWLKNLLDFNISEFHKVFSLSARVETIINSKFPLRALHSLMIPIEGAQTKIAKEAIEESGTIPVITQEVERLISGYTNNAQPITDLPIIVFGDHSCSFKYIDFQFVRGADGTQLIKLNKDVEPKYVYEYLKTVSIENSDKYERHFKYLKNTQIPTPPIHIQKKIISECEKVDQEYNTSRMSIETYRQKIADIFNRLEVISPNTGGVIINKLCKYITSRTSNIDMVTYITTDNMLQNCEGVRPYEGTDSFTSAIAYQKGDILLSNIRPYLKKIWQADHDGSCSPDVLVLRPDINKVDAKFLFFSLRRDEFFDFIMNEAGTKGLKMPRGNKDRIIHYRINLPMIEEQRRIAAEISQFDELISKAKETMRGCANRKMEILNKYLQ